MTDEPTKPEYNRYANKARITVECTHALKSRLEATAVETGLTVTEIGRYALWAVVLDAEGNPRRFCQKVARERLKHLELERVR